MRKNRFFSLLFAFCPGAGEMYLGLMKRGAAIMLAFWGIFTFIVTFRADVLAFFLPVIWFYSFFDTLTLRNLEGHALGELQERDEYLFFENGGRFDLKGWAGEHRPVLGIGCIFLGISMLYSRLMDWLYWSDLVPPWLQGFLGSLPSFFIAFVVIALGLWLVRGKKMPADRVDDCPEYHRHIPQTAESKGEQL